jgi:cytidylate kinase
MIAEQPPVIAIDGPTASGKGTVAALLAGRLGFHYLDSGAIYRVTALAAIQAEVDLEDALAVAAFASHLDLLFQNDRVYLNCNDVTAAIRSELVGQGASKIAVHAPVRAALLQKQRGFAQAPGLVADGRDMATVVFPDACVKVFLTADVQVRAQRRYKQLLEKGNSVKFEHLLVDLEERDHRDVNRLVAPLKPTAQSQVLDSTLMSVEEIVDCVYNLYTSQFQLS